MSALIGVIRTRVPLVHSSLVHAEQVFKELGFFDSTVFYELGSGTGPIVFLAERMGAGRVVGFELVSWAHAVAVVRSRWRGSHAEFQRANFLSADWKQATVLYTYLLPELLPAVYEKFMAECPPGAVLVCKDFGVPGKDPSKIYSFEHPHRMLVYMKS